MLLQLGLAVRSDLLTALINLVLSVEKSSAFHVTLGLQRLDLFLTGEFFF